MIIDRLSMYEIKDLEFVDVGNGRMECETTLGNYVYICNGGPVFFHSKAENIKDEYFHSRKVYQKGGYENIANAHWRGILEPFLRRKK